MRERERERESLENEKERKAIGCPGKKNQFCC